MRYRNTDFARAFVRTASGIRSFVPRIGFGCIRLDHEVEQGANVTA